MKKISRKRAIKRMGVVGLSPVIPTVLLKGFGLKKSIEEESAPPFIDRIVLQPFDYNEVKLKDGFLNRQMEYITNYYLRIPNDDLLKGFRERIGLTTYDAKDLGGWYTRDFYHIFGQILSGISRLYAVSRDESCKEKVTALIEGWAACIEPDGYFYYSRKPNAQHYIFDKMVGGLVDANIFTKNKEALNYLSIITDWAIKNLDRKKPYARTGSDNGEWYTLGENLYRAYQITKEKKYFDFAHHWEYTEYWNILAKNESIFQKDVHYHAYSHLNTLSSAAMAYLLKGERHYLDTLKNGFNFFQEEECFATGGYGPFESLLPKKEIIDMLLSMRHNTFETQCGTWAAFKLCKYLLLFTGDARYGDWIEKLIYNGTGASIPLSSDGKVFYYSDYNPRRGTKENYSEGWSCCSGTISEDVAEYSNLIFFKNKKGIFVNLYTPSLIQWNNLSLTQETRFPEDNLVTVKINTLSHSTVRTSLHFRRPGWLNGYPEISINQKKLKPRDIQIRKNWIVLTKEWKDNDEVLLRFPINLSLDRLDNEIKYPVAITYGPVVMAIRSGKEYPSELLEKENSFQDFVPVQGSPLNWHVKNKEELLIRPFYSFKEGERYILYFDPTVKNWIPHEELQLSGDWKRWIGDYYFSKEIGASIEAIFKGTGIRLHLVGSSNSGKCQVWIDDKLIDTIDEFRPEIETDFYKDYTGLHSGKHTTCIKVLGKKNEKSKDTYINLKMFEILISR